MEADREALGGLEEPCAEAGNGKNALRMGVISSLFALTETTEAQASQLSCSRHPMREDMSETHRQFRTDLIGHPLPLDFPPVASRQMHMVST
jgi:hypothetical protein